MVKYDNLTQIEKSPDGRYVKYDKKIGSGAYKTVFLGYDTDRGIDVAWNVIPLLNLPQKEKEQIAKETKILQTLQHPNIIDFYNTWENKEKNEIVFTTEIVSSGTLKDYTKRSKQRSKLRVIKKWCRQILKVLKYLHTRNPPIIHRDLKCDNIFINGSTGEIKVGDLGLSTMSRMPTKTVLGTPEFMAPEMYDEKYNEMVDIYSFGMCFLELCTNEYPYQECENPAQIYKKVVANEKPEIVSQIVDPKIRSFIEMCICNQHERLSAAELLHHPFLLFESLNDIYCVELENFDYSVKIEKKKKKKDISKKKSIFVVEKKLKKNRISADNLISFNDLSDFVKFRNSEKKLEKLINKSKNSESDEDDDEDEDDYEDKSVSTTTKQHSSEEVNEAEEDVKDNEDENVIDKENEREEDDPIIISDEEEFFEKEKNKMKKEKKDKGNGNYGKKEKFYLIKKPKISILKYSDSIAEINLKLTYNDEKKRNIKFKFNFKSDTVEKIINEMNSDLMINKRDCTKIGIELLETLKKLEINLKSKNKSKNKPKSRIHPKKKSKIVSKGKLKAKNSPKKKEKELDLVKVSQKNDDQNENEKKIKTVEKRLKNNINLMKLDSKATNNCEGTEKKNSKTYKEIDMSFLPKEEKNSLSDLLLRDFRQKLLLYFKSLSIFNLDQLLEKLDTKPPFFDGKKAFSVEDHKKLSYLYCKEVCSKALLEMEKNFESFEEKYSSPLSVYARGKQCRSTKNVGGFCKKSLVQLENNIDEYIKTLGLQKIELERLRQTIRETTPLMPSDTKPFPFRRVLSRKEENDYSNNGDTHRSFSGGFSNSICLVSNEVKKFGDSYKPPPKKNSSFEKIPELYCSNLDSNDGILKTLDKFFAAPDCSKNLKDYEDASFESIKKLRNALNGFKSLYINKNPMKNKRKKEKFSLRTEEALKEGLALDDINLNKKETKKTLIKPEENKKMKEPQKKIDLSSDADEAEKRLMSPILNFKKNGAGSSKKSVN